jgi:iron-sulfur cluster repair protein YtfE (RIC family)
LIDALLGEHGAFNALFDAIENMAGTGQELAQIESATMILAAELESHARLEEELLFPVLKPYLTNDELIGELHAEHLAIQDGLERIQNAEDIREAVEAMVETLAVARSHFRKEEEVLYPMARRVLNEETQSQLGDAWAVARSVKIG